MFASSSAIIVPDADENIVQTTKSAGFYDVDSLGESSFLSEFTTSDFDVFDTAHGEIDPISEADVYLAYGRYQQAEELIRQAIKDQPNDDECKLKLLEIFYANENKTAFEAYAKELAEAGKNFETDFWVKVADMGKDICPDSSLFTGGAVASMAAEVALPATKANKVVVDKEVESNSDYMDDMDLDLDMVSFDDQPVDSHTIDDEEEFSLSSLDVVKEKTAEQPKDSNSIEFDLSDFSAKTKKIEPSFESSIDDSDIETFAFDFDTEPKPTDSKPASKIELKKTPEELDDFHDLDMSAATAVASAAKESNGFDSDFDFDFDFDSSAFGSGSSLSDTDTGFDIADLTDMDELETKLDLAKAYVDMGDISAAKDIANEILSKGSAEQKKSAQLLLNEIS
jgi:pilus assembly protein FimV